MKIMNLLRKPALLTFALLTIYHAGSAAAYDPQKGPMQPSIEINLDVLDKLSGNNVPAPAASDTAVAAEEKSPFGPPTSASNPLPGQKAVKKHKTAKKHIHKKVAKKKTKKVDTAPEVKVVAGKDESESKEDNNVPVVVPMPAKEPAKELVKEKPVPAPTPTPAPTITPQETKKPLPPLEALPPAKTPPVQDKSPAVPSGADVTPGQVGGSAKATPPVPPSPPKVPSVMPALPELPPSPVDKGASTQANIPVVATKPDIAVKELPPAPLPLPNAPGAPENGVVALPPVQPQGSQKNAPAQNVVQVQMPPLPVLPQLPGQKAGQPSENAVPAPGAPDLRIVFNDNETDVPLSVQSKLDNVALQLIKNPDIRVSIIAYASGSDAISIYPKRVSLARGIAVRNYLTTARNIDVERVTVKAQGNKNEDGPPNRVDLFLIK